VVRFEILAEYLVLSRRCRANRHSAHLTHCFVCVKPVPCPAFRPVSVLGGGGHKLAGASACMAVQTSGSRNLASAVRSAVKHSSAPDRSAVSLNFGVGRKSAGYKAFGRHSVAQNVGVNRKLKVPVAAKTRALGSH